MSDLQEIKKRIYEEERVIELLEKMGCEYARPEGGGKRFVAQLPPRFGSSNTRMICILNDEHLTSRIWNHGVEGDIYNIVSYIVNDCRTKEEQAKDIPNAKRFICKSLGYVEFLNGTYIQKPDDLDWLKKLKRQRKQRRKINEVEENRVLDESVLKQYELFPGSGHIMPYKEWLDEGIDYKTQVEFEVGFDIQTGRVIFPIRNKHGQLIGVKGRAVHESNAKYLYLYECHKHLELFNLHRASPYIEEAKKVIVFEGAKSVMKAWSYGYRNCVAIEGGDISDIQIKLLKKLGSDIEIIFAYDKDKTLDEIRSVASRIYGRIVTAIIDEQNLLEEKDSPVDKGIEVWEKLYRSRVTII